MDPHRQNSGPRGPPPPWTAPIPRSPFSPLNPRQPPRRLSDRQLTVPGRMPPAQRSVLPQSWLSARPDSDTDIIDEYIDDDDDDDSDATSRASDLRGIATSPVNGNNGGIHPSVDSFSLAMAGAGFPRHPPQNTRLRDDRASLDSFQMDFRRHSFIDDNNDINGRDRRSHYSDVRSTYYDEQQQQRQGQGRGPPPTHASLTSLRDLIHRAGRLASNLDRGRTASRIEPGQSILSLSFSLY